MSRPEETGGAVSGGYNHWIVAVTVTLATFMEVLDTTIANVALEHIAGNLSASRSQATWVLTSYLVANAIVLPLSGWFSNLIGRKRFYMSCVFLFTVSSALCGMASSLPMLILFRVFQGAGGGGLQPSEQAILVDTFPARLRGMAMAVYGIAVLVAPILGPALGGWLTDNYSWRWIFFINVPVGVISLILTSIVVQDPPELEAERKARIKRGNIRVDYVGISLISLGLGSLEVVYAKGQEKDWFGSTFVTVFIVLSVVGIVAAILWEWFHDDPIINLRLFKERNFAASGAMIYVVFAVLYGSTVQIPAMLQELFGYDATRAGLILSPGGLVTMAMMPVIGWVLGKKVDARWLIAPGLIILGGASYWMTGLDLSASPWKVLEPRLVQMFAMAFLFAPLNTAAYLYLPKDQTNNATGLFNMLRNEGGSLGIALAETMLARRSQYHQSRLVGNIREANPVYHQWVDQLSSVNMAHGASAPDAHRRSILMIGDEVMRQARMMSYIDVFWIFAMGAFLSCFLVFFMKKSVAEEGAAMH